MTRLALLPQHAAGNQLQDELLAGDGDRVPGVVSAGIAGHHAEILREHVDDLALAFIAPLGAHHHCRFHAFFNFSPLRAGCSSHTASVTRKSSSRHLTIAPDGGYLSDELCTL